MLSKVKGTLRMTSIFSSSWLSSLGQFHQHVYAPLLRAQISKAQNDWQLDCIFCNFGICALKSYMLYDGEIDPLSHFDLLTEIKVANFHLSFCNLNLNSINHWSLQLRLRKRLFWVGIGTDFFWNYLFII